jgi:hypothetical protein
MEFWWASFVNFFPVQAGFLSSPFVFISVTFIQIAFGITQLRLTRSVMQQPVLQ